MTEGREQTLTAAFMSIANSLVGTFDVVDLLSRLATDCVALLGVTSAGLLLADDRGVLHVVAASSEQTRSLEIFQLQRDEGPCLDSFRTGLAVDADDLAAESARWPQFAAAASGAGIASVHALPMRLQEHRLGTLGLFRDTTGPLGDEDRSLGQALADVASITIVHGNATADRETVVEQLQTALASRVVVEQAKGLLAQYTGGTVDDAFTRLRRYARDGNRRLTDVARSVVDRSLDPADLAASRPRASD